MQVHMRLMLKKGRAMTFYGVKFWSRDTVGQPNSRKTVLIGRYTGIKER